jgi:Carboxypeptidase regulatory-like domain
MPSIPSRCLAVLAALIVGVAITACDSVSAPSPVPGPSSSAQAGPCIGDDLEASGIEGRVVDEEGNPLNDIAILIETPNFHGDTRTGEEGVFTAPGVTGEFVITTIDIDYQEVTRRVTVACGETVDVELVLTPVGG